MLGVLAYVRSRPDADAAQVFLAGHGGGAVVALHAAAVEEGVRGVEHDAGLATYRSAVEARRSEWPVADFLPGGLPHYDLPDLATALAPTDVLVLDPRIRGTPPAGRSPRRRPRRSTAGPAPCRGASAAGWRPWRGSPGTRAAGAWPPGFGRRGPMADPATARAEFWDTRGYAASIDGLGG
jgi:hypothetical protein